MAKQGFYGREYIKTKDGDYDYQAQVNRLHNLRQWDRDETYHDVYVYPDGHEEWVSIGD